MKRIKRTLAVILAAVMLVPMCALGASASKRPNYLLLGDSIAYGQGIVNSRDACYGRIVANTNNYNYANDAVSGTTSAALLVMLTDSEIIKDVKKADIITISTGGNDFLTRNWVGMGLYGIATGNYSKLDPIVENYRKNLTSIITRIKKLNPDAVIIVQTIYNPHNDIWTDAFQQGVDRMNNAIKAVKKQTGGFEIANVGAVISGHPEYIAADTIHPNAKGNIAIAEYMLKFLKKLGLGTKTKPVIKVQPVSIGK
ncbi:MAG: hypothetical protein IK085_06205 [Clostridia bacterium]|nr:hypothetical protein [Clostridia bacterium]